LGGLTHLSLDPNPLKMSFGSYGFFLALLKVGKRGLNEEWARIDPWSKSQIDTFISIDTLPSMISLTALA